MAKVMNFNLQRPSQQVVASRELPNRRFTDSNIKTTMVSSARSGHSKQGKGIINLGLSSEIQESWKMKYLNQGKNEDQGVKTKETPDWKSKEMPKQNNFMFFGRKKAVIEQDITDNISVSKNSPSKTNVQINLSPSLHKIGQKKSSMASASSQKYQNGDILKFKMAELEKKIKKADKGSRSYRAELSGDTLGRKPSEGMLHYYETNNAHFTILPPSASSRITGIKGEGNKSYKQLNATSSKSPEKIKQTVKKSESSVNQSTGLNNSGLIERELDKLTERLEMTLNRNAMLIRKLDETSQFKNS